MLKWPFAAAGAFAAAGLLIAAFAVPVASGEASTLPARASLLFIASDGIPVPGGPLPPADPSYCPGATGGGPGGAPPNSIIGTLTIGGSPAPAGTIIQVAFDGLAGPARRTTDTGGYRLDYAAGIASCANHVGAAISILVNGQAAPSGVNVGDPATNPVLIFNVSVN